MNQELASMIKKLKNQKAKEWRANNKEKVKLIQERYWIKKAKEELNKKGEI